MDLALEQFIAQNYWYLIAAILWTYPWKGVALWRAAKNRQLGWFITILILNTMAILEITYLFYFEKPKEQSVDDNIDQNDVEK
jgi:uncharacterized membrane protein